MIKTFPDYQVDPICARLHCVYIDPPLTATLLAKSPVILLIMSSRAYPLWMSFFLFKKKKEKEKISLYLASCDLALGEELL